MREKIAIALPFPGQEMFQVQTNLGIIRLILLQSSGANPCFTRQDCASEAVPAAFDETIINPPAGISGQKRNAPAQTTIDKESRANTPTTRYPRS
jgi:hypothetical protein